MSTNYVPDSLNFPEYKFSENGCFEFYVNQTLPPVSWTNILTNGRFGYIAADCGNGFMWMENAREAPVTPWINYPGHAGGVEKLDADIRFVAIADGARCLTTPAQITKVCLSAYRQMAACAAHKISDTVKRATVLGNVQESVDREGLWQMQTPQVFHTALYQAALVKAQQDNIAVTDDSSLIEAIGYRVHLVECGLGNIKITVPEDLTMAKAILDFRNKNKK